MNRNMVLAEWRRAGEALRAAETLTRDNCCADAISRAYYAILHAAKAALYVRDVAAESHAAVRRLFGLHLVQPGEIEAEWSAHLVESLDDRLAADYDAEALFSKKEARQECKRSREFPGAVYHLTSRGNARQRVYVDDLDRELFFKTLSEVVSHYGRRCRASCLMKNHYELLVETPKPNLSLGMRQAIERFVGD